MRVDPGIRHAVLFKALERFKDRPSAGADSGVGAAFIHAYRVATFIDLGNLIGELFNASRPNWPQLGSVKREYFLPSDSEVFDAHTSLGTGRIPSTVITTAVLHGLEDMASTITASDAFLSQAGKPQLASGARLLGRDIFWNPKLRYVDYTPVVTDPQDVVWRETIIDIFRWPCPCRVYFEALPATPERFALAQMLVRIGILWILLHEEGHIVEGHLRYRSEKFGVNAICGIADIGQEGVDVRTDRVIEWCADRVATTGVIDVVLRPAVLRLLPQEIRSPGTLLRLAFIGIGCAIFIFDYARRNHGETRGYPRPRTRLAGVAIEGVLEAGIGLWSDRSRMTLPPDEVELSAVGALEDLALAWWGARSAKETHEFGTSDLEAFEFMHNLRGMRRRDEAVVFEQVLGIVETAALEEFRGIVASTADLAAAKLMFGFEAYDPTGGLLSDKALEDIRQARFPDVGFVEFKQSYLTWTGELHDIIGDWEREIGSVLRGYETARPHE